MAHLELMAMAQCKVIINDLKCLQIPRETCRTYLFFIALFEKAVITHSINEQRITCLNDKIFEKINLMGN